MNTKLLSAKEIANMIDLSAVQTYMGEKEIIELVEIAKKYDFNHISVFNSYIKQVKNLTQDMPDVIIIGNVGFPSGGETTISKIEQAKELAGFGCKEIDMVINVGKLKSGKFDEVEDEIRQVKAMIKGIPLKVILEVPYLTDEEIIIGSQICIRAGANFVKTGTGWTTTGTTIDQVKLIKKTVEDQILIKASGGIRDLNTLIDMYVSGASRFGINLNNAVKIVEEVQALPGSAVLVK